MSSGTKSITGLQALSYLLPSEPCNRLNNDTNQVCQWKLAKLFLGWKTLSLAVSIGIEIQQFAFSGADVVMDFVRHLL